MSVFRREGVRVALIQSRISQGEKETNWRRAMALFDQAITHDPKLVVFPEAFVSGVNFIILRQMAERVPGGATFDLLRELARRHAVHLVAGVLEGGDDGRVYDSAVAIDPDGRLLGKYRRRFLWVGERNYVSAGAEPVTIATDLGKLGLIVGYDICFPEACASFLRDDVDIIACPSSVFARLNFNAERLALSRAMDHHCYFLYANALGFHQFANMEYTGRSGAYADPYFLQVQMAQRPSADLGCLTRAGTAEEYLITEVHPAELVRARTPSRLPFKGDERHALNAREAATREEGRS